MYAAKKIERKSNSDTIDILSKVMERTDKEIKWAHWSYGILIPAITLIVAVGIYFSYQSLKDYKTEIKETGEHTQKQLKEDTDKFVSSLRENVTKDIASRIDDEFKKEQISKLVQETAKQRIDTIANELIKNQIETQITPLRKEIEKTKNDILSDKKQLEIRLHDIQRDEKKLKDALDESRKILDEIKRRSEFIMTFFAAQCDDRTAYNRLVTWSNNDTSPLSKDALIARLEIEKSYVGWSGDKPYLEITWGKNVNSKKLSYDDICKSWYDVSPECAKGVIMLVWEHDKLTKEQKLEFLHSVLYDSRNSLAAADKAARLLSEEAKVEYKSPFNFQNIEKCWATRKSTKEDTGKIIDSTSNNKK